MGLNSIEFAGKFSKNVSDYTYTEHLTDADWAWEFLRRNAHLRADVYTSRVRFCRPVVHVSGVHIYRMLGNQSRAHHWGLACFADPDLSARQTDVFWESEVLSKSIDAIASIAGLENHHPDMDLFEEGNCVAVLCANDRQKLLFRFKTVLIDMTLTGPNLLFSPVNIQFHLDGFEAIGRHAKTLLLFYNLTKSKPLSGGKSITERERFYRKRYLIALDCHQFGGSLQDTAKVFQAFGLTRLKWSTSGDEALKKHVWRCRNKGLHLMRGGYRNYL